MNRSLFFNRLFCLILLILAGTLPVCLGQEEEAEKIQFRRWLAPADRIDDWPYGLGRYLPIDRKVFEQWTELLKKTSEQTKQEEGRQFTRIVLEAKLDGRQLSHGKGYFHFRSGEAKDNFLLLEPWGLWIDSVTFEDGTPVSLVRGPDEKVRLLLPADKKSETKRIKFQWSLRCRSDAQRELSFDFALPPCAAVELRLDLPGSMVPTISSGIVMKPTPILPEEPQNGERRWRILPGRNSPTVLTIIPDENKIVTRQKTAIQQTIRYSITQQKGTEVTAKFFFDKSDARLNELLVDLESPLRVTEIRYGERPVSWSQSVSEKSEKPDKPENKTARSQIRIDLSEAAKDEPGELTVDAVCPVQENRAWLLPRIRAVSSNVFWKDTRCGVHVQSPLLVRDISCERAVQVTPRNPIDRSDLEQFVFQYFDDDSQLTVDLATQVPQANWSSAVQIQWGNNEIRGNMTVDYNVVDGKQFTLEIPISPDWTIDSVRSVYWTIESTKVSGGDQILTWDVIDAKNTGTEKGKTKNKILSIQLKHQLKSLRLQLTGHFQAGARNEFRLGDVFPLILPDRSSETHYIAVAVQSTIPYHLQFRSQSHSSLEIRNDDSRLAQRFVESPLEMPAGTVFPMNAQTRELWFSVERLKPNYTAEIVGNVLLKEKELTPSFRFRCQPVDSSVDRVYVHFTPRHRTNEPSNQITHEKSPPGDWTWSAVSEAVQPLQTRLLSPKEQQELNITPNITAPTVREGEAVSPDETYEIRLAAPQTTPFEIRAVSSIPLQNIDDQSESPQSLPIPLASMPMAAAQKGEIYIESPKLFQYHIVNSQLKSIPIAPTEWYRYQEIRAAFRYEPAEEIRTAPQPSLSLQRMTREETPPPAWIWSLRLDTQYEAEGIVKDNAVFLLENRGKDSLRIRLPDGINVSNVHAVWRDDQRITWHPDRETDADRIFERIPWTDNVAAERSSPPDQTQKNIVVVSLPEGTRFVSVSLEYSHQDTPLNGQRKLQPQYPSADVPILSGNWTLWLPPEFDVNLRQPSASEASRSFPLSEAMNNLLPNRWFDPFSVTQWKEILYRKSRYREADVASRVFFRWIAAGLSGNAGLRSNFNNNFAGDLSGNPARKFLAENTAIRSGLLRTEDDPTWAAIFYNENKLIEMLGENRSGGVKGIDVKIMLDKQAFAILGMTPTTTIAPSETGAVLERGAELFEREGLVLFVSSKIRSDSVKEYTFYITSFLTSSLHRQFSSVPIGNCSRYLPETADMNRPASEFSDASEQSLTGFGDPQWIPMNDWIKQSPSLSMPWSISPQIVRLASITPDWFAFEMSKGSDQSLYIVHKGTFAAYHWLAFLAVVVLTSRKPFSSPIFLIALLILFEILARSVTPCYIGIPSGAFLGAAVSLAFGLIRSRTVTETITRFRRPLHPFGSTDIPVTELTNSKKLDS